MAQRQQILRLMLLANRFSDNTKAFEYQEIYDYLEKRMFEYDENFTYSEKTFQRDRILISDLLKMEIDFDFSAKKYRLTESSNQINEFIGNHILLVNAYKQLEKQNFMLFDNNAITGIEHIFDIVNAIKNSKIITCNNSKFWDTITEKKILKPYALKQFENRWYLLAQDDHKDTSIRSYGLDRITHLEITSKSFKKETIDPDAMFKNSFGIISTLNLEPTPIVLSFDAEQGKYIKALPLHHSQQILKDTQSELQIELYLHPTYDFYQELLKHAGRVKILSPKEVQTEYKERLMKALELNP